MKKNLVDDAEWKQCKQVPRVQQQQPHQKNLFLFVFEINSNNS